MTNRNLLCVELCGGVPRARDSLVLPCGEGGLFGVHEGWAQVNGLRCHQVLGRGLSEGALDEGC